MTKTEWQAAAYAAVQRHLKKHKFAMVEDIREAFVNVLPPPPDNRSWGSVIQRAAREGLVQHAGFAPNKSKNCHGSFKALWKSNIYAGA